MVLPLKQSILTPFDVIIISKDVHITQIYLIHIVYVILQNNLFI